MHSRIDWGDLQFVLAVAEHGSLANAARALGVSHTTVLRRVNALEAEQGVRLFERLTSGYRLTAGGEKLLAAARDVAATVTDLERKLAGKDLRLEGSLRVTTTDTLMASLLPAILRDFRDAHPDVVLELSTANAMANLTKRDADVAIRPSADPPENLVGRRVGDLGFAVYAAPGLLDRNARPGEFADLPWLAPDATLARTTVARWMRAAIPDSAIRLRADSLLSLREAARAGLGAAALPCYLGDTTTGLARLTPEPVPAMASALWVLTHEDLRRSARVAAFTDFAARALAALRPVLEGRARAKRGGLAEPTELC